MATWLPLVPGWITICLVLSLYSYKVMPCLAHLRAPQPSRWCMVVFGIIGMCTTGWADCHRILLMMKLDTGSSWHSALFAAVWSALDFPFLCVGLWYYKYKVHSIYTLSLVASVLLSLEQAIHAFGYGSSVYLMWCARAACVLMTNTYRFAVIYSATICFTHAEVGKVLGLYLGGLSLGGAILSFALSETSVDHGVSIVMVQQTALFIMTVSTLFLTQEKPIKRRELMILDSSLVTTGYRGVVHMLYAILVTVTVAVAVAGQLGDSLYMPVIFSIGLTAAGAALIGTPLLWQQSMFRSACIELEETKEEDFWCQVREFVRHPQTKYFVVVVAAGVAVGQATFHYNETFLSALSCTQGDSSRTHQVQDTEFDKSGGLGATLEGLVTLGFGYALDYVYGENTRARRSDQSFALKSLFAVFLGNSILAPALAYVPAAGTKHVMTAVRMLYGWFRLAYFWFILIYFSQQSVYIPITVVCTVAAVTSFIVNAALGMWLKSVILEGQWCKINVLFSCVKPYLAEGTLTVCQGEKCILPVVAGLTIISFIGAVAVFFMKRAYVPDSPESRCIHLSDEVGDGGTDSESSYSDHSYRSHRCTDSF